MYSARECNRATTGDQRASESVTGVLIGEARHRSGATDHSVHRLFLTFGLSIALLLIMSGTAYAGTITVNLKPRIESKNVWGQTMASHRNAATIYIYGPSGYYRSSYVPAVATKYITSIPVASIMFSNAPIGAYRVRIAWSAGNGAGAVEANQYPQVGWWVWQQSPACDFTSP